MGGDREDSPVTRVSVEVRWEGLTSETARLKDLELIVTQLVQVLSV